MSGGQLRQRDVDIFDAGPQLGTLQWFAITTRSRHEKMVVEQLDRQRIESFLPLVKQIHKWSDRQKEVELPLFSGYTFVRLIFGSPDRLRVLKTYGVAGFVGMGGMATAVPEAQIENVKTLLANQIPMRDHPFLQIGQRVRIPLTVRNRSCGSGNQSVASQAFALK